MSYAEKMQNMGTAEWALVISAISLGGSIVNVVWSIWSKFIHPKPSIKVYFSVWQSTRDINTARCFAIIQATNFGPTETTLTGLHCRWRKKGWKHVFRDRWHYAHLFYYLDPDKALKGEQLTECFPGKIAVASQFIAYMPIPNSVFVEKSVKDIGFSDVFGKFYWVDRRVVKKIGLEIRKAAEEMMHEANKGRS